MGTKRQAVAKAMQTKAAKRENFSGQSIPMGNDWQIIRADEMNWEVQFKGKFQGFYPTVCSALFALPLKMLNQGDKNSIADVQRSLEAIRSDIRTALDQITK